MNAKHTITFIIIAALALLIVACGAARGTDATPEPAAPAAPPEVPQSGGRPGLQGQGQGPGFGGGANGGGPMGILTIISEAAGLDFETLREEAAGGATMAEIITANGGDVEAAKAKLIEARSEMPNAQEEDIEQRVSDLLNNPLPMPGIEGGPGGLRGDE